MMRILCWLLRGHTTSAGWVRTRRKFSNWSAATAALPTGSPYESAGAAELPDSPAKRKVKEAA